MIYTLNFLKTSTLAFRQVKFAYVSTSNYYNRFCIKIRITARVNDTSECWSEVGFEYILMIYMIYFRVHGTYLHVCGVVCEHTCFGHRFLWFER